MGWDSIGFGDRHIDQSIGNRGFGESGNGDNVAGMGFINRGAFEATERENLGDACGLENLAVARQGLDRLIDAHGA